MMASRWVRLSCGLRPVSPHLTAPPLSSPHFSLYFRFGGRASQKGVRFFLHLVAVILLRVIITNVIIFLGRVLLSRLVRNTLRIRVQVQVHFGVHVWLHILLSSGLHVWHDVA